MDSSDTDAAGVADPPVLGRLLVTANRLAESALPLSRGLVPSGDHRLRGIEESND